MDTKYDNIIYQDSCYYKVFGNWLELYDCYGDKKYVKPIFNEMGKLIEENDYIKYVNVMNKIRPKYIIVYWNNHEINVAETYIDFLNANEESIINCPYKGKHNKKDQILNYLKDRPLKINKEHYVYLDIEWCDKYSISNDKVAIECCTIL